MSDERRARSGAYGFNNFHVIQVRRSAQFYCFEVKMCMGMGFPMGTGIPWKSHGNGNKTQNWEWEWDGREWKTTSVGMGITCTPMGIYSQRFYAAMS